AAGGGPRGVYPDAGGGGGGSARGARFRGRTWAGAGRLSRGGRGRRVALPRSAAPPPAGGGGGGARCAAGTAGGGGGRAGAAAAEGGGCAAAPIRASPRSSRGYTSAAGGPGTRGCREQRRPPRTTHRPGRSGAD